MGVIIRRGEAHRRAAKSADEAALEDNEWLLQAAAVAESPSVPSRPLQCFFTAFFSRYASYPKEQWSRPASSSKIFPSVVMGSAAPPPPPATSRHRIRCNPSGATIIQAVSKGLSFLGVRGRGGHRESKKDRKLGSKTYQF